MSNKPREFWINGPKWIWDKHNWCEGVHLDPDEQMHVIEYSAYEAVCKERDELTEFAMECGHPATYGFGQYCAICERDTLRTELDAVKRENEQLKGNVSANSFVALTVERDRLKADLATALGALENWLVFEREQIRKEGPYCGERITKLINEGEAALAKLKGQGGG